MKRWIRDAWQVWRWPIALGLAVTTPYVWLGGVNLRATFPALFASVITVSAIAVGFLASMNAILLSIQDNRIVKEVRDANLYAQLIDRIALAIYASFVLAGLSLLGLIFDPAQVPNPNLWFWFSSAFLFVLTFSGVSAFLVVRIIFQILRMAKG